MGCDFLEVLEKVIRERIESKRPDSYTYRLYEGGPKEIAKKVGEEATEVIVAYLRGDKSEVVYEIADLLYHVLVLLSSVGLSFDEVCEELIRRYEDRGGELLGR